MLLHGAAHLELAAQTECILLGRRCGHRQLTATEHATAGQSLLGAAAAATAVRCGAADVGCGCCTACGARGGVAVVVAAAASVAVAVAVVVIQQQVKASSQLILLLLVVLNVPQSVAACETKEKGKRVSELIDNSILKGVQIIVRKTND